MAKKKGLGKPFTALLGTSTGMTSVVEKNPVATMELEFPPSKDTQLDVREIKTSLLKPGRYQARKKITEQELTDLATSIEQHGVLQPIIVQPVGDTFEILAGERRYRASIKLGLETVPAIIKPVSNQDAMLIGLIENLQRENLNPIEEAEAIHCLHIEFKLTHQEIAAQVMKSRTAVTNALRLLKLQKPIQKLIEEKKLEVGHAKVLLTLDETEQARFAHIVVEKKLSVRELERLIEFDVRMSSAQRKEKDPDVVRLEQKVADLLGARVVIKHNNQGKGKITIPFNSLDEFEGIMGHLVKE